MSAIRKPATKRARRVRSLLIAGLTLMCCMTASVSHAYEVNVTPRFNSDDGTYTFECRDGQLVWVPSSTYLYFRVDGFPTNSSSAYVEITYYDESTGPTLSVQYDSVSSDYTASSFHTRTTPVAEMAFVKSYQRFDNPLFAHREDGGSDFRINTGGLPVKRVVVRDTLFSDPGAAALTPNPPWLSPYAGPSRDDVNADSIKGKVVAGYQGWFRTPNDMYDGNFRHWTGVVDMWPDRLDYNPEDLVVLPGAETLSGQQGRVFSSASSAVVQKHFEWMRKYNIDGVYLQRFFVNAAAGANPEWVLANVREAAHREGRVWAIEYDISSGPGQDPNLVSRITADWKWLVDTVKITEDSRYLHEQGKPVVVIWGAGIRTDMTVSSMDALVDFFKNDPIYGNNFVVGFTSMSFTPEWEDHNSKYDSIAAWMGLGSQQRVADAAARYGHPAHAHIWPGFSRHNDQMAEFPSATYQDRAGGNFFWDRISTGVNLVDPETFFIGMFDEYNEGTAVMPMTDDHPVVPGVNGYYPFIDNVGSPKDWWLTLSGTANDMLNKHIPITFTLPTEASLSNRSNIGQELSVVLGATNVYTLLQQVEGGDGSTTANELDGVSCRRTTGNYMYFNVDNSILYQESAGADVTIIVDYYDATGGVNLALQYDSVTNDWKSHPKSFISKGDACWKSVRFEINDAYFGDREIGGTDFRINGLNNHIARVRVILSEIQDASTLAWNPRAGSPNWTADASWAGGVSPLELNQNLRVELNVEGTQECILDTRAVIRQLALGDNGTTNGNFLRLSSGADLVCGAKPDGGTEWTSIGYNRPSTLTVEDGAVFEAAADLLIGFDGIGDSCLDIDGGLVNVNATITLGNATNTSCGFVTIDGGGRLGASGLTFNNTNCVVDVRNGSVVLAGDQTSAVNGYRAAGNLIAFGGVGQLEVDYNLSHPGFTTVSAIEPPSTTVWSPVTGYNQWTDDVNWTGGAAPLDLYQNLRVELNVEGAQECILDTRAVIRQLALGDNGTTHGVSLRLSSGADLVCGAKLDGGTEWTSIGYNRPSTLTVEAGAVFEAAADLLIGFDGTGDSRLDVDGGLVNVNATITLGNAANTSHGFVTLDGGGRLDASGLTFNNTNCVVDVWNGSVVLAGDQTLAVNGYIANENLIAYGGIGQLEADYNLSHSGFTTVSVIASYDVWAIDHGIGTGNDDDDGDSRNNFYEYVMRGNPTDALDRGFEPFLLVQNGGLIYAHIHRNDDPDLVYSLEATTNLVTGIWTDAAYTVSGAIFDFGGYDLVINQLQTGDDPTYIRLKVEAP